MCVRKTHCVLSFPRLIRICRRKQQGLEPSDLPERPCPHLSSALNFLDSVFLCLDTSASLGPGAAVLQSDVNSLSSLCAGSLCPVAYRVLAECAESSIYAAFSFLLCFRASCTYKVSLAFFKAENSLHVFFICVNVSSSEFLTQCLQAHWYMQYLLSHSSLYLSNLKKLIYFWWSLKAK